MPVLAIGFLPFSEPANEWILSRRFAAIARLRAEVWKLKKNKSKLTEATFIWWTGPRATTICAFSSRTPSLWNYSKALFEPGFMQEIDSKESETFKPNFLCVVSPNSAKDDAFHE